MYYGFPERREEMHDYLKDILHGREPPKSLIDENLRKLDLIGGETPSTKIVNSIRDKLADRLAAQGFSIYLISKHYRPSFKDAVSIIRERIIYEVPLFPIYSTQIFNDYFIPLESSLGPRNYHRIVNIGFNNGILSYFRSRISTVDLNAFSAHSIPIRGYDPYPLFITSMANELSAGRKHVIFYHSQGPFSPRWLGPDMEYMVKYLTVNNIGKICVVPIGFLYEHIEILYDLDYVFREKLDSVGIGYSRIKSPNDSDTVINAIIDTINE